MVENNVIDLGVVESPVLNKNLVVEVCRVDKLVAVVAPQHPLAERNVVTIHELLDFPYICREEGSGTREVIADYMTEQGINSGHVHLTMELGSPESIKGAVEAGMGVSIMSSATVQKELKLGTLVSLILEPSLERPFSFVHQKQKFRHRAMDELLEFARNYCKSHPEVV
jgi:DNA-binding transcriptional LysR family regulator